MNSCALASLAALIMSALDEVSQDVTDASDKYMLSMTRVVAREIAYGYYNMDNVVKKYDFTEISVIDENGIIVESSDDVYIGYNEHVPAGCSDLCTSIAGYEEFRGGIRDYDYLMAYEADPNDVFADPDGNIVPAPDFEEYDPFDYDNEIKAIYPSFEVDESDEEILDLFPEFDDYDSLNESGDD